MDFYILANVVWNGGGMVQTGATGEAVAALEAAGNHPTPARCPKALAIADAGLSQQITYASDAYKRGSALFADRGLHSIWQCASYTIAEAERLMPSK